MPSMPSQAGGAAGGVTEGAIRLAPGMSLSGTVSYSVAGGIGGAGGVGGAGGAESGGVEQSDSLTVSVGATSRNIPLHASV